MKYLRRQFTFLRGRMAGLALVTWIAAGSLPAQSEPTLREVLNALQEPVTVALSGGQFQKGRVTQWDGTSMTLEVSIGGGVAEMTFPKDDIAGIQFPGGQYKQLLADWQTRPERAEDALTLFRAYYLQQGAYLSLLSQRDLGVFIEYADFALQQNEPIKAVAIIDVIKPYIEDKAVVRQLNENLLLGFFAAGMLDEAEEAAREWIKAADPAGESALGWRLMAQLHFDEEDYETAFWTALHPVAFSNRMTMAHLDVCYALAILSAEELRLKEKPEQLAADMRARGFDWPESVDSLRERAPDYFRAASSEGEGEEAPGDDLLEEPPIQSPSPIDPIESLPTRIYN